MYAIANKFTILVVVVIASSLVIVVIYALVKIPSVFTKHWICSYAFMQTCLHYFTYRNTTHIRLLSSNIAANKDNASKTTTTTAFVILKY